MTVSVIVAAYYSDQTIAECLEAFANQTYRDFEVIVVNSSPEKRTEEIVAETLPEARFVQSGTRLLPHAARNRGVELARGDLLVFTDADCRANPDWLERLVAAASEGRDAIGGSLVPRNTDWFGIGVHLCKFHWALPCLSEGSHWILPTANVAYSRRALEKSGPFVGDLFCGDALMTWQARLKGCEPWFEPRAVVASWNSGDFRSLWRERVFRGREFMAAQMAFECWTKKKAALRAMAAPASLAVVLARGARDSWRCGMARRFAVTLPVQLVGHLGWILGETQAMFQFLSNRAQAK